jgi:hypothetical protein
LRVATLLGRFLSLLSGHLGSHRYGLTRKAPCFLFPAPLTGGGQGNALTCRGNAHARTKALLALLLSAHGVVSEGRTSAPLDKDRGAISLVAKRLG